MAFPRVMQICIVLPSRTLAHTTIDYTGNTAILLAVRSNAANLLVRRCTRGHVLACNVFRMYCMCRNYVVLWVSSSPPWL